MKRSMVIAFVFLIILFCSGFVLLPKTKANTIDQRLKEKLMKSKKNEKIPVLILFKKQGSKEELNRLFGVFPKERRRKETTGWLKKLSDSTDEEFKGWIRKSHLSARVTLSRKFWLVNGVEATASTPAIRKISSFPSIAKIYLREVKPPGFIKKDKKRAHLNYVKEPFERERFKGPFSTEGKQIDWNLKKIRADEVWRQGYTGRGIIVAVLDSGMNYIHPDIRNNLWINEREIPENGKDDDCNGYVDDYLGWNFAEENQNIEDSTSHGTEVSGIIAGDGSSGIITGVAPQTTLMVLKPYLFDIYCGRYDNRLLWKASQYDMWLSLQYALENGADIANLSLSYSSEDNTPFAAWRYALSNATHCGLTIVASAGNDGERYKIPNQIHIPASIPEVIAVGGTDKNDLLQNYSSRGPVTWESVDLFNDFQMPSGLIKPDLCSPLGQFPSICWYSRGYNTDGGGGTSSSCPHVAGVVALMLEKNPELMPWEIKKRLEETCVDCGFPGRDSLYGWGRVDAYEAVNYGSRPIINLTGATVNEGKNLFVQPGQDFEINIEFRVSACPLARAHVFLYSPNKELKIIEEKQVFKPQEPINNNNTFQIVYKARVSKSYTEGKKVILKVSINAKTGRKLFFEFPVYIGASELLVVDDDGQGESERPLIEALDHDQRYYHYVNTLNCELTEEKIMNYKSIIWTTGKEFYNTLDDHEQNLLKRFFDSRGSLILMGENIGEDIGKSEFYKNYLHAKMIKDSPGDIRKFKPALVYGREGDPISKRLILSVYSNYIENQYDLIRPLEEADDPFYGKFKEAYVGFVRYSKNYRLLYSSIGMNSIKDIGLRAKFLDRVLEWFEK